MYLHENQNWLSVGLYINDKILAIARVKNDASSAGCSLRSGRQTFLLHFLTNYVVWRDVLVKVLVIYSSDNKYNVKLMISYTIPIDNNMAVMTFS